MALTEAEMSALLSSLAPAGTKVDATSTPLTCTVCRQWLDQCHADLGTHPSCDPTPEPATPPPSTVAELANVLADFDANSERSLQSAIGPSEIAVPCDRRLAYAAYGITKVGDGRVPWAPMVGTAIHAMISEALTEENKRLGRERWLIERRVHPDPSISGSCDAYDVDTDTVIDWKCVGKTALEKYIKNGPGQQYEGQIHLYGRGWQRAGRAPKWVRIVFLARASHRFEDAHEWTAPYSRPIADAALDRLYAMIELCSALGVGEHPERWDAIPSQPHNCQWCPYLRRGGPADDTGCPGDVDDYAAKLRNAGTRALEGIA